MRSYGSGVRIVITSALCASLVVLMACGDGNNNSPAADQDEDTVTDTSDGDTVDETVDVPQEEEIEEVAETPEETVEESAPPVSKCNPGAVTSNPVTVSTTKNGAARVCEAESPLDGSYVAIEGQITSAGECTVTVKEGEDIVQSGWKAIGPAVHFDSDCAVSGALTYHIPFDLAELSDTVKNYSINVIAIPNGGDVARFIPKSVTSITIERTRGVVHFEAKFLGAFQVVTFSEVHATHTRTYAYRGWSGVSMGAGGASIFGLTYPTQFDVIGMLGGPDNLWYLHGMVYTQLMGGFCSEEEVTCDDDTTKPVHAYCTQDEIDNRKVAAAFVTEPMFPCGATMKQGTAIDPGEEWLALEPGSSYIKSYLVPGNDPDGYEHPNGFNHWYYDMNGGNFSREEYVKLFRDLNLGFGNMVGYNPDSPYLSAGLPVEIITYAYNESTKKDVCDPTKLTAWMADKGYQYPLKNYYDDEYNRDGVYDVITFCDGTARYPKYAEAPFPESWDTDEHPLAGDFVPGMSTGVPVEFALAVDYNGNGVRDFGEPVIRNMWEPYEDCGLDHLCNVDEPGYDPVTKPDPNGDDYHYLKNPAGTENNRRCDCCDPDDSPDYICAAAGKPNDHEIWYDYGLDGIEGTPQLADGGYDYGEGNKKFDYNPNIKHSFSVDGYRNIEKMDLATLAGLHIYADGGVRDLFNFGVHATYLGGLLKHRLGADSTIIYDGFENTLSPPSATTQGFNFMDIDYGKLGHNVVVRYGSLDATPEEIKNGNGRHVGTIPEVIYRVQIFLAYAAHHFPNADVSVVEDYDLLSTIQDDFHPAPAMGQGKYRRFSIFLPPGYDENPDVTYPVVYLGHGYGMDPQNMAASLYLFTSFMAEGTLPKFITVFPDGACESSGVCLRTCKKFSSYTGDDLLSYPDKVCSKAKGDMKTRCQAYCSTCNDLGAECYRGTFYANHQATIAHPGGWQDGEQKDAQMEDIYFDLDEWVSNSYRVKQPIEVEVDSATYDWVY